MDRNNKILISAVIFSIFFSSFVGGAMGFWAGSLSQVNESASENKLQNLFVNSEMNQALVDDNAATAKTVVLNEGSAVIKVVNEVSPAVVSIIVSKDLPVIEKYYRVPSSNWESFNNAVGGDLNGYYSAPIYRQNGTEKTEIGGGTGFLVSADGYLITNKHVVADDDADYTVLMNDETTYTAKILAKDKYSDIAILKIEGNNFPFTPLGDSSNLQVGQSVITIGNSLGEFRNTVSTGVISGLARNVSASGAGLSVEELADLIQTDAAINPGNSGGPLLDINGQAVGMNTAIAEDAQNIGFALPINAVKDIYENVRANGKIVRPWLGVRYVTLNSAIVKENNLSVDNGALIIAGQDEFSPAVVAGSPAALAGLVDGDIIVEIDGTALDATNPLSKIIGQYKPGETVELKINRGGQEKILSVKLEEML